MLLLVDDITFGDLGYALDYSIEFAQDPAVYDITKPNNTYERCLVCGKRHRSKRTAAICGWVIKQAYDTFQTYSPADFPEDVDYEHSKARTELRFVAFARYFGALKS